MPYFLNPNIACFSLYLNSNENDPIKVCFILLKINSIFETKLLPLNLLVVIKICLFSIPLKVPSTLKTIRINYIFVITIIINITPRKEEKSYFYKTLRRINPSENRY